MAAATADVIGRTLQVLDRVRSGNGDLTELAGVSIALQVLRAHLVTLFAFPTFPEEGLDTLRIGTWDSLPPRQRMAYAEVKAILGLD